MSLPPSQVQAEENTEGNTVISVETPDQQRQRAEQLWLSCVREWFPNLHQQTYFLPPLHFNRVPYKIQTVCGQVLLVPQQAQGYASQVSPSDVSYEPSVGACQLSSLTDSEQSLFSSTVCTTQQQSLSLPTPSGQDHLTTTSSLPSAHPSQIEDLVSSPKERSLRLKSSQPPSLESRSKTTSPLPSSAQTPRGIWDPLTILPPRLPVVLDSDVRDDRALQHVLCCLRALGERQREVMMVISQMQFGKYLNKPVYSAAAALLPRPINLAPQYHRGDFDLLIIHHKYGLIVGEVKSVGSNFALLNKSEEEKDALIVRAVDKSIAQLNRAQYVLKYMVTDFPNLNIRKTLIMPNISSGHLSHALNCSIKVQKDLCLCLEVPEVSSAVGLCLCADHLSSNTTTDAVQALHLWWQQLIGTISSPSLMPDQDYERLIARFCGPATTVEVFSMMSPHLELRTIGDGVSETGKRLAHLTLYPDQVELLNAALPRMFLTGPPGTGKTVMLVLQGLQWLQKGYGVHVVSTWREGLAASFVVEYQLGQTWVNQTLPGVSASCNRVHRHQYQIQNEEDTTLPVSQLSKYCDTGQIGVLIDEAGPDNWFSKFCDKLVSRIPDIVLWAASVNQLRRPACLEERLLTVALRSPPVVVRQVSESQEIHTGKVLPYKSVNIPPPTDGPPILRLAHHDRPGHVGIFPDECELCGHAIANTLNYLGVAISETRDVIRPHPLQYCDVLVLCSDPCEDQYDSKGNVITKGSGLVRGLRSCKVPVCVVERINNDDIIRRVALAMCDEVTVAHWDDVKGLERRVVIVPGYLLCHDVHHRLYAVSRCSSQLVIIE